MIEQVCFDEVLIESAREVFETMVFMDIAEDAASDNDKIEGWALLGTITFSGELEGCFAICCSTPCAQAIAMNMLGIDSADQVSEEEVCDAIGEIANMVMGSIKARLIEKIGNLNVSIPSVISGRELRNNLGEGSVEISRQVTIEDEYLTKLTLLYREKTK